MKQFEKLLRVVCSPKDMRKNINETKLMSRKIFRYRAVVYAAVLGILLILSACSSPAPKKLPVVAEAPPPVLSFGIDPVAQTVKTLGASVLSVQQIGNVQIANVQIGNKDFQLKNFTYEFLADNKVRIYADFVNAPLIEENRTPNAKALLVPISFEQNGRTSEGIKSLSLPLIDSSKLDGRERLSPYETVRGIEFLVEHQGSYFEYFVDAFSKVEKVVSCIGNFGSVKQFATCKVVYGTIVLSVNSLTATDRSILNQITAIKGNLTVGQLSDGKNIEDTVSVSIENLFANLERIDGTLQISGMSGSLSGFPKLKHVEDLNIFSNRKLRFSGLNEIQELSTLSLRFNSFDSESLKAFAKLNKVKEIYIENNFTLENLSFLRNLQSVSRLEIFENENLTELTGLETLSEVDQSLKIYFNKELKSINKLAKLDRTREVEIYNNVTLDCSLLVQAAEPYAPKFLPITKSFGNAVDCPLSSVNTSGSVLLTKFEELAALEGVKTINGNLSIRIKDPVPSSALAPLAKLEHVEGDFILDIVARTGNLELSQLTSLKRIDGSLRVYSGLKDFAGLSHLKTLSLGGLEINHCGGIGLVDCSKTSNVSFNSLKGLKEFNITSLDELILVGTDITSFDGVFPVLKKVTNLTLEHNDKLRSLSGLEAIELTTSSVVSRNKLFECNTPDRFKFLPLDKSEQNLKNCPTEATIFKDVFVSNNDDAKQLEGIAVVAGSLTIQAGSDLTRLDNFESLRQIKGDLTIGVGPNQNKASSNVGLNTLTGLEKLETVEGNLVIRRNTSLSSMTALSSLKSVLGFIQISDNAKLNCSASPKPAFLPANTSVNNSVDCETKTEAYQLSTNSTPLELKRSASGSVDVKIVSRATGFNEAISFSVVPNPNVSVSFDPVNVTSQNKTKLNLTLSEIAPLGTLTLVIKAESVESKVQQSTTLKILVSGNPARIDSVEIIDNEGGKTVPQGTTDISLRITGQHFYNVSDFLLYNDNRLVRIRGAYVLDAKGAPKLATATSAEVSFAIPPEFNGSLNLDMTTDVETTRVDSVVQVIPTPEPALTISPAIFVTNIGSVSHPFTLNIDNSKQVTWRYGIDESNDTTTVTAIGNSFSYTPPATGNGFETKLEATVDGRSVSATITVAPKPIVKPQTFDVKFVSLKVEETDGFCDAGSAAELFYNFKINDTVTDSVLEDDAIDFEFGQTRNLSNKVVNVSAPITLAYTVMEDDFGGDDILVKTSFVLETPIQTGTFSKVTNNNEEGCRLSVTYQVDQPNLSLEVVGH